ncbi:hypothetical protein O181_121330, partial [Austropuccinia psidii MF-1]|nr:hypothetical protein [Austropuccinia psidii MF-1]
MMMKPYPSANGHRDLKQAYGNDSGQLALSPHALICPPPLLGHHLMVTSLLDLSKVIIWPMKDGNGERTFEFGQMGFKCQKQNPPNPPRQDSPVPSLPCEQTPRQPTPGPNGTRWSEELFGKPPIPGPSPSSQPPEDDTT